MSNSLEVAIPTFESFLAEDAKALSDANHHARKGDLKAASFKEPAEHLIDKNGIQTDDHHKKANKVQGDATIDKKLEKPPLKEGKEEVEDEEEEGDDE